jgi:predicted DNA-binding transcriptional regulator AlpA
MDIVQKFGEDVAVPKNPEREGSPRLITIGQIAEEHGVSRSSVHNYRRSATFPRPVQVEGSTKTQYRADEVAAWFEANPPQQGKRTDLAPPEPEQGEPVTTTVDPRTAVLSDLCHPEWNPVSESHGMSHDDAVKLLDAYRAAVLREVATEIEEIDAHPNASGKHSDIYKALAHRFRRQADEVAPQ